MIGLFLSTEDFEQDIRPLYCSFFPKEEVTVTISEGNHSLERIATNDRSLRVLLSIEWREDGFSAVFTSIEEPERMEREDVLVALSERKTYRDEAKRAVYRLLRRATGRELPWGTLTGVRPVKPVLQKLMNGCTEEEIDTFLQSEYYASEEKRALSIAVAKKEKSILERIDYEHSYSLYVGIPFCPSICLYCSFSSYPLSRYAALTGAYVDALVSELRMGAEYMKDKKLATIYFGGGTPTALSAEELRTIIRAVKQYYKTTDAFEWTVEAGRPDTITREKLVMLKEEGITRISINPQTMNQRTLDLIGRRHTVEQVEEAFLLARDVGFDNINMDLILGLNGENAADVAVTLSSIGRLSPDSVTVHTLAKKRAARLSAEWETYRDSNATEVKEMLKKSVAFARQENYAPYYLYRQKNMEENLENVGYARDGKEGIYNILIMEEKHSILAFGAGAATKLVMRDGMRVEREENVKSLTDYLQRTEEMIERKREFFNQYRELL